MNEPIATRELQDRLANGRIKLIDVRPIDAWNGWPLQNESRGGHIAGARTLPAKWADYIDWIEIVRSKEIAPNDEIILYGYDVSEVENVAERFRQAGYANVRIYPHFMSEWCRDRRLPMDRLPRYQQLVPPEWLREQLTHRNDTSRVVLCHAHYQNPGDYEQGHIPGALPLDTNALESPETWNRRTPDEIKEVLTNLGIRHDSTVVLYGRFSHPDNNDPFPGSSAGHLGAFRCAFIMMYAGVRDVRMLNGGIQAWQDAGFDVTTRSSACKPVPDFGATMPGRPDFAVDLPQARQMLEANDANLVCVRSWPEFIGEVSGYHYIEKKGRIPGAVFANCGSDAYHMENYRNLDHTTREFHEITDTWRDLGITADKHNAFYCGTGWRGSEAFFNAWLLGWPRVAVFDGGWFEWSRDEDNPYETGVPA